MMRGLLALGLAWSLLGCANNSNPLDSDPEPSTPSAQVTAAVGETFRLGPGEIARVGDRGFFVLFLGVAGDSRCPSKSLILCVWEGNAVVETGLTVGNRDWNWHVLNTTVEPKSAVADGYRVTLVELAPYPETTDPIDPAAYVATYRVERR